MRYAAEVLLRAGGIRAELQIESINGKENTGLFLEENQVVSLSDLERIFFWLTLNHEQELKEKDYSHQVEELGNGTSDRPWINELALNIARQVGYENNPSSFSKHFHVIITHDVDRTVPCEPYAVFKTVMNQVGLMKRECYPLSQVFSSKLFIENVEKLLQFELDHGIRSIFFFLSGPYSFARYGTRYDIRWSLSREILRLVQQAGMYIGLHGSYYATRKNSYQEEKKRLEDVLGEKVTLHRNHYLNFDPYRTWAQLEEAGFEYDNSMGFPDNMGFRAGIAGLYPAFDLRASRPLSLQLVPIILDESTIEDIDKDIWITLDRLRKMLQGVGLVRGMVSLLFHPDRFALSPGYWKFFEKAIGLCHELEADISGKWENG